MKSLVIVLTGLGVIIIGISVMLSVEASNGASSDRGREVYAAQKCAVCHSIAGIGGEDFPLDGIGAKMRPDIMRKWIRTPKEMKADTEMKAYPNLPEKDLRDLIAYLMTLK